MLKAQLLKHLLRIPSDRRLALRLRHDRRAARACGFGKRTPSHGLFTHFRHRLGEETYLCIFNHLLQRLLESGVVSGRVIAVDSTHVDAYSQRAPDNRTARARSELAQWTLEFKKVKSGDEVLICVSPDTDTTRYSALVTQCKAIGAIPHVLVVNTPKEAIGLWSLGRGVKLRARD